MKTRLTVWKVVATPLSRAINQKPQYAWGFNTRQEAEIVAKEQRARRVFRSVRVEQDTEV